MLQTIHQLSLVLKNITFYKPAMSARLGIIKLMSLLEFSKVQLEHERVMSGETRVKHMAYQFV